MIVLLTAESDEGWLGYIRDGYSVSVHARTREEARVELLKKLQQLGLPFPPQLLGEADASAKSPLSKRAAPKDRQ
jgi:hypothetical protein